MRAIAAYRSTGVQSASQQQIVTLLYQEAVRCLDEVCTPECTPVVRAEKLHKVRAIFIELLEALDPEQAPELCAGLRPLYVWCIDELSAGVDDLERIAEVRGVAETLLAGWVAATESPVLRVLP